VTKRTVIIPETEETVIPEEQPSDEDWAEWERQRRAAHEKRLAPYRAFHEQQNEQDDLLAELLFQETMRELEG